jgi:septum formation protein
MESIVLASRSPRRKELLEAAGIPFECRAPELDESIRDALPPAERVIALALDKARAALGLSRPGDPRLILGADTLVCLEEAGAVGGEAALGKPAGEAEARSMLERLSGRVHTVRTGLALLDRASGEAFAIRSDTKVGFAALGADEIGAYLSSGEWEGVAGAYRIQGLAAFFVDSIEGSWTGVVGLPLRELYVILHRAKNPVLGPFQGAIR